MAIKVNILDTTIGVPLPEAYIKVDTFSGEKHNTFVSVIFFATEAAYLAQSDYVMTANFSFSTISLTGDIIPAIYNRLKTLTEFAGATDC